MYACVCVCVCMYVCDVLQVTGKDELVQAKDRELAQAQQQLRQQVIFIT